MTAATDVPFHAAPQPQAPVLRKERNPILRGTQRIMGAALFLSAVGLFIIPMPGLDISVSLFKVILCVTAAVSGVALVQASIGGPSPQFEVDTIRREIRLVAQTEDGGRAVVQTTPFSRLHSAEIDGKRLLLWHDHDVLLTEIMLSRNPAITSLLASLTDEGKLD